MPHVFMGLSGCQPPSVALPDRAEQHPLHPAEALEECPATAAPQHSLRPGSLLSTAASVLESLESCSWRQALPVLSMAAFGSVCLAAGVLLSRRGSSFAGPAPSKPSGEAAFCKAATPVADKPAPVIPADHPRRRRRGRGLRRDDSAHHPAAAAANFKAASAAGNRDAGPLAAPEAAAATTRSTEAWPPAAPEATAAAANSREAGAPTALEAAADSTDDGAPEASGTTAAATHSNDMGAPTAPEATAAAAGSSNAGPPAAPEATSAGSNSLLPPPGLWTAAAAADNNAGAACTAPDAAQRAGLDPGQPQKDTAAGDGAQGQARPSLTGCGLEEQADRLPSMELAHNLLNTGGSETLLTSGESEQWDAELLLGQGRSRDSSLDGAWEALLGLTVNDAPRDSLDERYAPQEAAGRRLNGGMMFPAEGDAFPDEPRLGALATVRRSLDQAGAGCAGYFFICLLYLRLYLRQLDLNRMMGCTSDLAECVLDCLL